MITINIIITKGGRLRMIENPFMALPMFAGLSSAIFGVFLWIIIGLLSGLYIYWALAMSSIAKKLGYKNTWLAWIPIAQFALIPILAEKEWPWAFMFLVPIANIIFMIIWMWRIYERRNYPGALSLIALAGFIPHLSFLASVGNIIVLGLVAWVDRK